MTPILYKHYKNKGQYILVTKIDPDGLLHYLDYNEATHEILHRNGYRLPWQFKECHDPITYKMLSMLAL